MKINYKKYSATIKTLTDFFETEVHEIDRVNESWEIFLMKDTEDGAYYVDYVPVGHYEDEDGTWLFTLEDWADFDTQLEEIFFIALEQIKDFEF